MFKNFLKSAYKKAFRPKNERDDDDDDDDDQLESDNTSVITPDIQHTTDTNEPVLGRRCNALNRLYRMNSSDESSSSRMPDLGSRPIRLFNRNNDIDEDNDQVNSMKNDIDLIGRKVFELNKNLNKILAEKEQRKSISIGGNSEILQSRLNDTEDEQTNLFDTQLDIGNNIRYLNEKLESLNLIHMDDEFVPILGSTVNQLELTLKKLQSTMKDEAIVPPKLANQLQHLNQRLNSMTETIESPNFALNWNLGKYVQLLSERIDKLKTILYERYQAKFEELFEKLKLKHEDDLEHCKQRNKSNLDFNQYSKYCIQSRKPKGQLRTFFRAKLQDDLKFRHYYHVFLYKYKKNLFRLILNESDHYIPKSQSFIQCLSNDQRYNLYEDLEQLKLIYQFLKNIYYLDNFHNFRRYAKTKSVLLNLFLEHIDHSMGQKEKDYLNLLKESYAVFIRDHILKLTEQEEDDLDSREEIKCQFDQIKNYNDENLKMIHDLERRKKIFFLKQWKGEQWNEKLILDQIEFHQDSITHIIQKKDEKLKELKSTWLNNPVNCDAYAEYENYVISMEDSETKSENLFEISQIYQNKKPRLRLYLKKSIHFLNKSISIDEFIIKSDNTNFNEKSDKRTQLRNKHQLRAFIHLDMAASYTYPCYDKFHCLNKSKYDFIQFDKHTINESNIQYHPRDFIHAFKETFLGNNDSCIDSYDKILATNPYFFEAQYQKLLKFYELNHCDKIGHLHHAFEKLIQSEQPIHDLFEILINKKNYSKPAKNQASNFLNKIIRIKVKNNQRKSLYLQLIKIENSYQLKFNNEDQLMNLLKYGKVNMIEMKNHFHQSLKLSYQISNGEFQQLIGNLWKNIINQESNFSQLIHLFKILELINENQYQTLDQNFLNLLPEIRFNFIQICSNPCQSICEISRSIKQFHTIETKQKLICLKFARAEIYRKYQCFYLEEIELNDILKNQKTGADHNPIIYYRLSYLHKLRGNLQESIHFINLASKRYNEKMNKRIFQKIEKLKSELLKLENTKNTELAFIEKNQMNLLQILNFHQKFDFEPTLAITNGFEFFEDLSINDNTNGLLNCLFSHLIEDIHSIEEYLNHNPKNSLTQKYNELKDQFKKNNDKNLVIKSFNETFHTKFRCLFIKENNDYKKFNFESGDIPIILYKDSQSNQYITPKRLYHYMLLTTLLTRSNSRTDLKLICTQFFNDEIGKNLLTETNENQTIETFIKSMVECETMKEFTEEVVYFLMRGTYDKNCLIFWSAIADMDYNIDLKDTLHHLKELFNECIDEYHQEKEEEHKSSLELIDNLIEQNRRDQRSLNLLTKLKDEILRSLSIYEYVQSTSNRRKKLMEIISANYEIADKLRKLILPDCFNIKLDFKNPEEEEHFSQYLTSDDANEIGFMICSIIEDALSKPKMKINNQILTIEGYNIFLSEMLNDIELQLKQSKIQDVRLYGTNIFMDISLNDGCWKGINLTTGSDIIEFVKDQSSKKITIDLSGKNGKNGGNAENQNHATRESEDGNDGSPGENGEAGTNGGNIYFIANKEFRGKTNIQKLITSGGDGGKGGNGGNAGNGHDGNDGKDASEENYGGFLQYGYCLTKGKEGTRGGDGGRGGDAGLGAFGGHAGDIHIEENQKSITEKFAELIESKDKSNTNGDDGVPGTGGKGGKGGSNGNDVLYVKGYGISKNKKYIGNIEVVDCEDSLFGEFKVNFKYKEKIVKRNGVESTSGKSADAQLHSGKTRRKCEEKQKLNENEIKNQLNQMVNNNNEELANISNNITQSMNLLKDQMDDTSDERESRIKTHQLSNSLIENAYKIAQQSLAINATKVKTKTENNILRTADNNNANGRPFNQIELTFDQDEQKTISFERNTQFIEELKFDYQEKLNQLENTLNENIKQIEIDIKSLKFKGKNILFKLDIESMKSSSYLHDKDDDNESNFLDIDRFESNLNNELTLKQDISLFSSNYDNILFNSDQQTYQPFLLNEYFTQLSELKKRKRVLINVQRRINKLNINTIVDEICSEYGSKGLIKQKLSKFDKILDFDNLKDNKYLKFFNIHHLIKQNDFIMDDSISYKPYLTGFFKDKTNDLIFIEEISNILIQSNIPLARIEKSDKFLMFLFRILKENESLKQFKLMDCTPIYHPHSNGSLDVHPIEELINQFINAEEKTIELMVPILKCFVTIIEKNEFQIVCRRKIENFIEFLIVNLIFLRINIQQGGLLNVMKRNLNSIQINYSTSLFNELFGRLELIILIKERQFDKFNNYIEKVKTYFRNKQQKADFDIKVINYIKHEMKTDIFKLFQIHIKLDDDINTNPAVQEFIQNFYLEVAFQDQMKIILGKFHHFLKNTKEIDYNVLLSNRKLFLDKLHLFLKKEKKKVKNDIEHLLLSKDKCETIIYLSYKNISLRTNINCLHDIDTHEDINVEDFLQAFKNLYEQLRLKEISDVKKSIHRNFNENDFNRNISQILLLTREMNSHDQIQIKQGYQIIIIKTNQFNIYYRNQNNYQIQNHQIDKSNVLDRLNVFNFNQEILLSKEDHHGFYKIIYEEVESNNGFTKYSTEQIELFRKLKEVVNENLVSIRTSFPSNLIEYLTNEIEQIYGSEIPDFWSVKISSIFTNINIIIKINDQFNLITTDKIQKLDFNNSNVIEILINLMKNLFEKDQKNKLILLLQCLSIFDYLLIKVKDNKLNYPIEEIKKLISDKTDDLEKKIVHEILLKNNEILKQYYYNEFLNKFHQEKERFLSQMNFSSDQLNLKEDFTLRFNELINNNCLALFCFIDDMYRQSSEKLNIFNKQNIYMELDKFIKDFHINIPTNQSNSFVENVLETSLSFLHYLQKQSLILISGIDKTDHQIDQILNELKTSNRILKRCPLRILSSQHFEDFKDEILIIKAITNEMKIIYRDLTDNDIESFIFNREQDKELFQLLDRLNNMDLIDDQNQSEDYQRLYSMVKSKNGIIYQNTISFDEKIFIQIFVNQILKNVNNISQEKFQTYIDSFEIILKNTNINVEILILLDENYQDTIKQINNQEKLKILNPFDALIEEKYQYFISNIEKGFANLMFDVQRKNRILNITWKYLNNSKDEKDPPIAFEKNELRNTTLSIKTILEKNQFKIQDIVHCYQQLNKALIQTPLNTLQKFKNQLEILKIKIRQFTENIDFPKGYQLKKDFDTFNKTIKDTRSIDNRSILNLLKAVLKNDQSIEPEYFQSIFNKILLNLRINNGEFELNILEEIEIEIKKLNQFKTIQKDYFTFLIETIQHQLKLVYKNELNDYDVMKKNLDDSMKEILDLFWSNISMSDLLNKEREKTYLNLTIEKLLRISNGDKTKQENILEEILIKLKDLQLNPDKKQFTNDIHTYLNNRINQKLNTLEAIILPVRFDDFMEKKITNILKKNYTHEDSLIIFNELADLFEMSIDFFVDEPIFNQFFQTFTNVFKYFSWRLAEYESKSKQEELTKIIDKFTASIKAFKKKVARIQKKDPHLHYNEFDEFEKIFNLRAHESQLQEELNNLQNENLKKLKLIDDIVTIWSDRLDNCMFKMNSSISLLGKEIFRDIHGLFSKSKKDLIEFLSNLSKNDETPEIVNVPPIISSEVKEERSQVEEGKNPKIDFELQFSILNNFSLQVINEEKIWEKKKDLIERFDSIKENLFDSYLKTIYEEKSDNSIDFDTWKNSVHIQNLKEILTQNYVQEWGQEINNLSINLFIKNLLEFYGFNFDILRTQCDFIEHSFKQNEKNDNFLSLAWESQIKENSDLMEIILFIKKFSKEQVDSGKPLTFNNDLMNKFIDDIKLIKELKTSIDTLYFFVGHNNLVKLGEILELKLIRPQSKQMDIKRLTSLLNLVSNFDDFNQVLELLNNFHLDNWLLYLTINKIESNLKLLFNRYLDELNMNEMIIPNSNNLDEFIERKLNETEIQYEKSLKNILNTLKVIELNTNIDLIEKESFFAFLKMEIAVELKKDANYLIKFNDLEKIFNKYLAQTNIFDKVINSLKKESSNSTDTNEKYQEKNDQLIIEKISSKSLNNLLPYLTRFGIIEQLELNGKALEHEQIKIIEYLELIKTSYSEEKMFQLVDIIEQLCKNETIIPHAIIDLLKNISNNDWLLNNDILKIIKTIHIDQWEKEIENYMKEKRSRKRDLQELIHLMKEDKNNLNNSIKHYLNSETVFHDLKLFKDTLNQPLHPEISSKPIREWNKEDIQNWSKKIKGNKLISDKAQVRNTIVIVSQAIYLFTRDNSKNKESGFYPRDTQITALWLFLNPDLNQTNLGCLAQISTGEGKSIIVAALAAIKALSCHRVDIITSSNVLAIRDAEEFQPFFQMFHLQVSNNCDALCEQGDGQQSAENVRKSRYFNDQGPVDIIYGECSCFERDILLTEINQNENIIGQRMSDNSISSVIIDEVDSMLLDKANMVLYLSHNIDTLKSLERVFISIWQTINQPAFEHFHRNKMDDDLIQLVSDMILEQIDNKSIDVPEYDSNRCDYINMKLFIKRRMPTWIKSAFHVRDMVPNDTYVISRDNADKSSKSEVKITVMDKDTGTEQLSTRWSNGVHQFLQLKHTRRLTPESLKAVFISNMSFFKRYKHHIIGLTGSLGSFDEQNLLDKVYKLRFFELPRFRQEQFRELQGSVYAEQENWLEAIKNALDKQIRLKSTNHDQRRAVLIICENVKSVLILKEYLSDSYPNAHTYKSAYEKFEIDQLHPGDIIIATNLAGRGTDLGTSDKLEENGGLHVITTYLPTNIRIEMQAFGRTARKGNKGTGEYIIQSQYGLSIEKLKQIRNMFESERLNLFLRNDLPKIKIEEDLLQGFEVDENQLSCIGFIKLYRNIENTLNNDAKIRDHGHEYIKFQLYSLKNRWAFWLDSMTEYMNMINVIGKQKIIEKFNEFKSKIEQDVQANNFQKLIIEPAELIKLGKYYRDQENWTKAILCYEQASKDKFYLFSNYYKSSCIQNKNYAHGLKSKRTFKHNLYDVRSSIEKELQFLNSAAQLAFEIGEKNRKLGFANYGNEYDEQVKEKSTIWSIFSGSITNAVGCPISPQDLMTNKYLANKKDAEKLYDRLASKNFIKPSRMTKKEIKNIELPSIFNNKSTKEELLRYLKRKRNARKLDEQVFKDDLKSEKIFLPYLDEFIQLIVIQGFIEKANQDKDNPLYLFHNFDEENLNKKTFPNQISNLKQYLFDCSKELTKENGFRGTKNEIFNRFNSFLVSKNGNQINIHQFNQFYQFLNENSCLEKLNQYSVIKDEIIEQNTDQTYFYGNLYDFERHYTPKFLQFESIFRQNFLKIILVQEDSENGDSYFTLKDTIDSNDFEVLKTEEDAVNYLWGYLKNSSFIKPARINIGLIESKEVKKKRDEIKNEIKLYFKGELSNDRQKELEEAVNTVFNIIDQTIGELKKIPDDKTITSYLNIKISYFLDNKKHVPEALEEFIELALDVIFRLEEKKEPPKWYEIAGVIALGVLQVVAGVLAKTFIPVVGQLIGEFLISTGCDDIIFGVQCAISGEFSWEKYWQHKKQSMINAALSAVFFVAVSFAKNAMKLKSLKKAYAFQKLTGAQKLHTAAMKLGTTANIGKYIGKEIAKTLVQTGLSELASLGIESMLEMVSNNYELELRNSIKNSIEGKWSQVQTEIQELFRLCEGSDQSRQIIDDCINRKLQNLPEATFLKNLTNRCAPVMQGLGKALANGSGRHNTLVSIFTTYAPSIINLGVNIVELTMMIDGFMKNLANDIKDARKKLKETNQKYVLTDVQKTNLKRYEIEKIDQISSVLSDSFNQKLKHGILAPVLNFAANKLISKGIEFVAGADRTEQLANRFELIHAASNPDDTLMRYADDLTIFLAEARAVNIKDFNIDPKDIQPENLNGQTLQQVYDLYGDQVKTFIDRDGKVYVRRPTSKEYYDSVRRDKPAGLHEQRKIPEVLGCEIQTGETVNNEQKCTLKHAGGSKVSFVVRDNLDGTKHAEIIVDGKPVTIIVNNGNKNDCYYNVAIVADQMSQGKTFDQAIQFLEQKDAVKNLRNGVSLAMKNDQKLLDEFKWTNRVDLGSHFKSLTGIYLENNQLKLDASDVPQFKISVANGLRPQKYCGLQNRKGKDENGNEVDLTDHHIIPKPDISSGLKTYIATFTDDAQLKVDIEAYLNDPKNESVKALISQELPWAGNDVNRHTRLLISAYIWNPNNLVSGPEGSFRRRDPKSRVDSELVNKLPLKYQTIVTAPLSIPAKLTQIRSQAIGDFTWEENARGKFIFQPNSYGKPGVSFYPAFHP